MINTNEFFRKKCFEEMFSELFIPHLSTTHCLLRYVIGNLGERAASLIPQANVPSPCWSSLGKEQLTWYPKPAYRRLVGHLKNWNHLRDVYLNAWLHSKVNTNRIHHMKIKLGNPYLIHPFLYVTCFPSHQFHYIWLINNLILKAILSAHFRFIS